VDGKPFIDRLPEGYDEERTRLTLREDNQIVATHPDHPPLLLTPAGRWVAIRVRPVQHAHRSSIC
jgi:hypothetical protein